MDRKKELKDMTTEMLERVEKAKDFKLNNRISLTNLARSSQWKDDLKNNMIMEVVDRTDTVGVLLSPEMYMAISKYIDELEEQLENTQIELLFKSREHLTETASGKELKEKTSELFEDRLKYLRGITNDGEQDN